MSAHRSGVRFVLWAALAGLGAASAMAAPARYVWEDEDVERGIRLQVSDVPEHGYDAAKATATLEARPETLVAVLRDIAAFPVWYKDCKRTEVLASPAAAPPVVVRDDGRFRPTSREEVYKLLFVQSVPMLEDRWAIIENSMRVTARGALVLDFRSLDAARYAGPPGAVRMRVRGRWMLEPLSRTRTRVTFIIDIDPNTSTPAFLVDPRIHEVALGTVDGLRRVAKLPKYRDVGGKGASQAPQS